MACQRAKCLSFCVTRRKVVHPSTETRDLDVPLPLADDRRFTSIHGLDHPLAIEEWTGTASR